MQSEGVPSWLIGAISIAVIAALAAGVYFWQSADDSSDDIPEESAQVATEPDVSAEVSSAVETPAERLPETNPFSGYKNPFD